MFVLINRQALTICHKHPSVEVVRALAHIELAHASASVLPIYDADAFAHYTDLELRLLHEHATGEKYTGYSRPHLVALVRNIAHALPESDVVAVEVLAQASAIGPNDGGAYKYVKGSRVPAKPADLYIPPSLRTSLPVAEAPVEPLQAATGPDRPVLRTSTSAAAPRAPSAPKGGARPKIFEVADHMWTQAGSPRDLAVVLALRKQIMTVLEQEHDIKKSTSSTALGDWQKTRLN